VPPALGEIIADAVPEAFTVADTLVALVGGVLPVGVRVKSIMSPTTLFTGTPSFRVTVAVPDSATWTNPLVATDGAFSVIVVGAGDAVRSACATIEVIVGGSESPEAM
jgi:hypothetical protein